MIDAGGDASISRTTTLLVELDLARARRGQCEAELEAAAAARVRADDLLAAKEAVLSALLAAAGDVPDMVEPNDVFAHGQLYVGVSRVKTPDGLKILAPRPRIANVVYSQVRQETHRAGASGASVPVLPGDVWEPGDRKVEDSDASDRAFASILCDLQLRRQVDMAEDEIGLSALSAYEDEVGLSVLSAYEHANNLLALSTFGSERFSKQRLIDEVRRQERALTGRFHLDSEPLSNGKYVFETNTLWLSSDVIAHACQLHRAERVYWQGSDVPVGGMMDPLAVNEFNQQDIQMNSGPQILNVGANRWWSWGRAACARLKSLTVFPLVGCILTCIRCVLSSMVTASIWSSSIPASKWVVMIAVSLPSRFKMPFCADWTCVLCASIKVLCALIWPRAFGRGECLNSR